MKLRTKIFWFGAGLFFVFLMVSRYLFGGWHDIFWIPLGLFLLNFILALISDFKLYIKFFSLRTTQNGMSMGALIILVFCILIGANFFIVKNDKIFDLTIEKMHSLDKSTKTVLSEVKENIKVIILYRGEKDSQSKTQIRSIINLYKEFSHFIEPHFVNAYIQRGTAKSYFQDIERSNDMIVFLKKGNKKMRVRRPFNEESITEAFIRLLRGGENEKIYFIQGHGEKELYPRGAVGLSILRNDLTSLGFEIKFLDLKQDIPKDATALAFIGPRVPLNKKEIVILNRYLRKGGHLFIAVDPGESHQINQFIKNYGVIFKDNYIVNHESKMIGRGIAGAFGIKFSKQSLITKKFKKDSVTFFDVASALEISQSNSKSASGLKFSSKRFKYQKLIESSPTSMVVSSLRGSKSGPMASHILGVSVEPLQIGDQKALQVSKLNKKKRNYFKLIIFGDSDFISDKDIIQAQNRDLALNIFNFLSRQPNLVSITPVNIKGDQFILTDSNFRVWRVCAWLMCLFFFFISFLIWYRRRSM